MAEKCTCVYYEPGLISYVSTKCPLHGEMTISTAAVTEVERLKAEVGRLRAENAELDKDLSNALFDHKAACKLADERAEQVRRLKAENAELRRIVSGQTVAYPDSHNRVVGRPGYEELLEIVEQARRTCAQYDSWGARLSNEAIDPLFRALDAFNFKSDEIRRAAGVESAGTDYGSAGASGTGGEEAGGGKF